MKPEQQQRAKELYLHTDCTQQQIAEILDVNRRTIYLWVKNGKWEEMKTAARQAPFQIIQHIHNHITAINDKIARRDPGDRCPTMKEVEKLRKLINMSVTVGKKQTGAYIEAYSELLLHIARHDKELAEQFQSHADHYMKGLVGDSHFYRIQEYKENVAYANGNLKKQTTDDPDTMVSPSNQHHVEAQYPAAPHNTDDVTPPSPMMSPSNQERAGERFCDKNEIFSPATPTPSEPSETIDNKPSDPGYPQSTPGEKYPIIDFPTNEIKDETPLQKILSLPPSLRPSPYRDGDTLWVHNIDDLDNRFDTFGNPWGERKMGDRIRRYSDLDK